LTIKNRLTFDSFKDAAKRVNLSVKSYYFSVENFEAEVLPLILIMNDGSFGILESITKDGIAKVFTPFKKSQLIDLTDLKPNFSGKVISVKALHDFDERTEEPGKPRSKRWFWGVLKKTWSIYSEVLIASFLVNLFALAIPLFIMNVYDRVVTNPNIHITLWVLTSGVFIVLVFDFILKELRAYFIDSAARNVDVELSKNIFSHILDIKMGERPSSVGTLANTVHSFDSFRELITSTTITVLVDLPFSIIFLKLEMLHILMQYNLQILPQLEFWRMNLH